MKLLGTRGKEVLIIETTRAEMGLSADAYDHIYDEAVQEQRADDAMAYDSLARKAYEIIGETR